MIRRLYLRLYLAFLGITVLSLIVTAILARALREPSEHAAGYLVPLARSLVCKLPGHCSGETAQRLSETAQDHGLDIVIWDEQGHPLFQAGRWPLSLPSSPTLGWHRTARGPMWLAGLGDGRMLGLRERGHFGHRGHLFLPVLAALAVLMAIGLYPLSRGITRRIEHLTEGARRWGAGDLAHRVPVEGNDEIASLAERFNQAAAAIQTLLLQEQQLLATASHELRTPLARIRMALELLAEEGDAGRRQDLARRSSDDIAELDALVEELLTAARTQVPQRPLALGDVLALVRGECEAMAVEVAGEPEVLPCEPAMIKRMVRNLLVNARKHGEGGAVRAEVRRSGDTVVIAVEDDGPGIPESERERIFLPFYRPPGPRPPGDTGLGLGLALVRQIASYHGGEVKYVERKPHGSRFEVTLPARRS